MQRLRTYGAVVTGTILAGLLIWLISFPGAAQEKPPLGDEPASPAVATDSNNFTLLGSYTENFVGQALNTSGRHAYVYFDSGLQVLDISNPGAIQHLGGRGTPQAGISDIERDGGLLYVALDRPSGFGGDFVELLSTEPITQPKLLGSYQPASPNSTIFDLDFASAHQLYVGQGEGIVVLDRFGVGQDGKMPVIGNYATDPTRHLLAMDDLLVADTSKGMELLAPGSSPTLLGKLTTTGPANAIALVGNTLYRSTGGGLEIIDISKRANPVLLRKIPELRNIKALESRGGLLYTTQLSSGGVRVYFASDPLNLIEAGHFQDNNFSAVGLAVWGSRVYATGNQDGMRILQYSGETPQLQVQATGAGVQVNGASWGVGQTDIFTQPFTIRLAQSVASLDLAGKCEEVLRILIALQPISSESFDPFEVFVEVLDISPTICEPARPVPVARSAASTANEARIDLRLDSGGLKVSAGDYAIFQNVKTPVAVASSRGQNSYTVRHDAGSSGTTVRSLVGEVIVIPENGSLAPVTLRGGQEVEVTASTVGEVKQVGGLFLPRVMR
ncbi:MAG: hypothetical protein KF753_04100 [Caldilineaceae bacterium]|nr:hypothetical protein [Caldilineaceae bacterium]